MHFIAPARRKPGPAIVVGRYLRHGMGFSHDPCSVAGGRRLGRGWSRRSQRAPRPVRSKIVTGPSRRSAVSVWTKQRVLDAAAGMEWVPGGAIELRTEDYRLIRYPDVVRPSPPGPRRNCAPGARRTDRRRPWSVRWGSCSARSRSPRPASRVPRERRLPGRVRRLRRGTLLLAPGQLTPGPRRLTGSHMLTCAGSRVRCTTWVRSVRTESRSIESLSRAANAATVWSAS